MKATLRAELFNIPNVLTYIRIFGIPLVMLCIWRGHPKDCVIAGWLYSLVCVTDYLDGWLARKLNCETVIGKFLDPLADKLMVMAMLVMLVALNRIPGWLVVVVLAREMSINGLRAVASAEGLIIPAGYWGKVKTATQMVALQLLLLLSAVDPVASRWLHTAGLALLYVAAVLSCTSAFGYASAAWSAMHKHE